MIRTTNSIKTVGVSAVPVLVECSIDSGLGVHLVGIADQAVRESLLRTVTAMQAKGYNIPGKRVVVNFAPADLRKNGTHYDLPIALSIIAASEQDGGRLADLDKFIVIGELGLDGTVRDVPGVYEAVRATIDGGFKGCIVPVGNIPSIIALLDKDVPVYPVSSLDEAVEVVAEPEKALTAFQWYQNLLLDKPDLQNAYAIHPWETWDLIQGNEGAKRAVQIAAAGGHPLLLMGAPGSGKSLLAKSLLNLLPPMSKSETDTVASIWSLYHYDSRRYGDAKRRPFRNPHWSLSLAGMLGGGTGDTVYPGEVSLAHNGVLYLDEFNQAPKALLEGLRAPLEDKYVTISRLKSHTIFPADFHLVAAMEPCPCGYYGESDRCTCTPKQREQWLSRLSGSIYDHLTVQAWCHPYHGEIVKHERFETVYARVQDAIAIQCARFSGETYKSNNDIPAKDMDKYCPLSEDCKKILDTLFNRLDLSTRAYSRIIKIARTIADLECSTDILPQHLAEASGYRFLDRRPSL